MSNPSRRVEGGLAALALAGAALLSAGCEPETRIVSNGWDRWADSMSNNRQGWAVDRGGQVDQQAVAAARGQLTYTIMLERFVGGDRRQQALAFAERVRNQTGLAGVEVRENDTVATVTVGKVANPGAGEAQRLLRQVQGAQIDGNRLFQEAKFVVADGSNRSIYDPLDLRQHEGAYTLQIGFYDDQFQGDRRRAAEDAARALREEGHQAYYYHGPHRSLLTVGLFSDADFVTRNQTRAYGPRIKALQEEFPYNLGNGVTLVEKREGMVLGEQESCLVRVF